MAKEKLENAGEGIRMSLRLSEAEWQFIREKGGTDVINKALKYFIRNWKAIEAQCIEELNGYFTAKEWEYLAIVLQKENVSCKSDLMYALTKTAHLKATADICGIDMKEVASKVIRLNNIHAQAIAQRVRDYWNNCSIIEMNTWANSL